MAEARIIETGTLAGTSPAVLLGTLLSIGFEGRVTFDGPVTVSVRDGRMGAAGRPVHEALAAVLGAEDAAYEVAACPVEGLALADPWPPLEAAVLEGMGAAWLARFGEAHAEHRVAATASRLIPWALRNETAAGAFARLNGERLFAACGAPPRPRDVALAALLGELGVLRIGAGERPLLWRPPAPPAPENELIVGSALDEARRFYRQGWSGAARLRLEDYLAHYPGNLEAAAFATWLDLQDNLHDPAARRAAMAALDLALARKPAADLLTFRGQLLRLENRYEDSLQSLDAALRLEPGHEGARYERAQTSGRMRDEAWPEVALEDVDVNAAVIVQRRIGGRVRVHSFRQPEIRIGSSDGDDIVVSDRVLPQVAKRHCTVLRRNRAFFVRRNASLGRVFVNEREIDIRADVPLPPGACVRLGAANGGPDFEFRVFAVEHLHDLAARSLGVRSAA